MRTFIIAGTALALVLGGSTFAQKLDKDAPPLDAAGRAAVERVLADVTSSDASYAALYGEIMAKDGDSTALMRALDEIDSDKASDDARRFEARRALAWMFHREGRLAEALAKTESALALRKTPDLQLERAHLLDELDRVQPALDAYGEVQKVSTDAERLGHVRLRIALLEASRDDSKSKKPAASAKSAAAPAVEDSALFRFASEPGADRELQNRAAVVLALIGRPREAIRLFEVAGEGTDRFRQEIRLAEWALVAQAPLEAQAHAWNARTAATLKRDRLYALTVLVEAHRADNSLDKLIARFATEPQLDEESRRAWIDLLRETSRVDEAMALFKSSAESGFTPQMRRELLEMCREAGREEQLVATYQQLITEEPERVEWREGLSRHWLESGRRDDARAVWNSYVDAHADVQHMMLAARSARDLGLEDLARQCAERCLPDPVGRVEARLFLFDVEVRRGRVDLALAQLEAFDAEVDPRAPQRIQLAEAFERIGNKKRAVDVLEGVRAVRGANEAEEDLDMRLAWLLSETGDEKKALERWRNLWRRVDSLSRRRQVEDRLMAVASRLGVLSDIAVELEDKLRAGTADDRDAALLVRLYTKVGDPVSAAEVIEEHMKQKGGDEIAVLDEKARIYLGGKDYYHFERTVRKLIDIDPERKSDHLRQLAMSNLERGKPTEARDVLKSLADCENPSDAAEFEAGVLALAGLNADAVRTYRRGLAAHPDRIDGYLLLANAMKGLRQADRAIGMFQYLAETADRDDLFTIAIDGLLNMRAKEPTLRWARRVTLERIARRHDKLYLYQLFTDLSEELEDTPGVLRALETSLAIAGEQRSAVLRQLMEASQGKADNSYVVINGVMQQRRKGGEDARRLAYGRRLIGLGDLVPPQVYLDLGETFLRAGEVANAAKTFSMARDVPDYASFRRQVAQSFEDASYAENALEVYERAIASEALDVGLLLKAAELHEQLGRDARAADLYARAIELLLAQHALTGSAAKKESGDDAMNWSAKNTSDFERHFPSAERGFVATADDSRARALYDAQRALLNADLLELDATPLAAGEERTLASCPRATARSAFLRRFALRMDWLQDADAVDLALLKRFANDGDALDAVVTARVERGQTKPALHLVDAAPTRAELRDKARARFGQTSDAPAKSRLALADVVSQLVPLLVDGDPKRASLMLRSVEMGATKKEDLPYVQLLVTAAVYMRDEASVVALTGYALRVIVAHAETWEERERASALLDRARPVIAPAAYDVLVDSFVALVAQKSKTLQDFQYVVTQLQSKRATQVLAPDIVKKRLEECLPDDEYMLPRLLDLVPVATRADLLRDVWSKVPATSRARTALELLSSGEEPLPPELAAYYADLVEGGIELLPDGKQIGWALRSLLDSDSADVDVTLRVFERAAKKWSDDAAFAFYLAAGLRRKGDGPRALATLEKALPAMPKETNDWTFRTASEAVVQAFGREHATELLEVLERFEAANGSNDRLDDLEEGALEQLGDVARSRAILEKSLARSPEKPEVLRRVYYDAVKRNDFARQVEMLEKLVRFDKKSTNWKNQLVSLWKRVENPIRALAVRREGESPAKSDEVAGVEAKKLEPATMQAVKKAVDEGRNDDARSLYRRLWRTFGSENGRFFYYFGGSGRSLMWPVDAQPKDEDDEEDEVARGGLEALEKSLADVAKKTSDADKKPKKTAYEALAELPFGADELDRQVRSLRDDEIKSSRDLLHGAGLAEVARMGKDAALALWTARARDGSASLVDRALLLSYFEDHLDEITDRDRATLGDLAAAVHPLDGAQLRALARIHAKLGETDRALRIYRWCATLATSRRWFFGDDGAISSSELIEEVAHQLQGDELKSAIAAILVSSDPGPEEAERDDYEALVLNTWLTHAGAREAKQLCAAILAHADDPMLGLRRETAVPAARIFAETGNLDRAVRCFEIAVAKFDDTQVKVDRRRGNSRKWILAARSIGTADVATLLPDKFAEDGDASAWCKAVAARTTQLLKDDRIEGSTARTVLAVAALRLHAAHADQDARACLQTILTDEDGDLAQSVLVSDLARRIGDDAEANRLEDAALAAKRLLPVRVSEVIARLAATRGDEAAFASAEEAAAWTNAPKLLDALIAMANKLGRVDRAAYWSKVSEEAAAATKELELAQ